MIQSIARALAILDFLSQQEHTGGGQSLKAIASHVGLKATTVHNILKTMVACGYLIWMPGGFYRLGRRCEDLARGKRLGGDRLALIEGEMRTLAEKLGEAVILASLQGGHRQPLVRIEGKQIVRIGAEAEDQQPFWGLVTGRILAAFSGAEVLEEILSRQGLPGPAWPQASCREKLDEALARIRRQGWTDGPSSRGQVWAIAVPVQDLQGQCQAALGAYLPAMRAAPKRNREIRRELQKTATRISIHLSR